MFTFKSIQLLKLRRQSKLIKEFPGIRLVHVRGSGVPPWGHVHSRPIARRALSLSRISSGFWSGRKTVSIVATLYNAVCAISSRPVSRNCLSPRQDENNSPILISVGVSGLIKRARLRARVGRLVTLHRNNPAHIRNIRKPLESHAGSRQVRASQCSGPHARTSAAIPKIRPGRRRWISRCMLALFMRLFLYLRLLCVWMNCGNSVIAYAGPVSGLIDKETDIARA